MGETEQIAFKGKLQKMQLISNSLCYGPCPQPEDEIEQRLTITANSISEKTANEIMEAVDRCFMDNWMMRKRTRMKRSYFMSD